MRESVLIAAAIVLLLNAAGSFIEFNNRFVNAVVDTVLFAVVFGALVHFGLLHMSFSGAHLRHPARQLRRHQLENQRWLRGVFRFLRRAYLRFPHRFHTCSPRLLWPHNYAYH